MSDWVLTSCECCAPMRKATPRRIMAANATGSANALAHEADGPQLPQLLRTRRERPRDRRADEERDELAPHTLPLVSHDQSLIGKHPVTRCQHVLWVELRLRCLD